MTREQDAIGVRVAEVPPRSPENQTFVLIRDLAHGFFQSKNYPPRTALAYFCDLKDFCRFFDKRGLVMSSSRGFAQDALKYVPEYIRDLEEEFFSRSAILRRLSSLANWGNWLVEKGDLEDKSQILLIYQQRRTLNKKYQGDRGIGANIDPDKLFQAASQNLRDEAMFRIAIFAKPTVTQLIALNIEDYQNGKLEIYDTNSHETRVVEIDADTQRIVEKYLNVVLRSPGKKQALFVGHFRGGQINAERLTRQGYHLICKRYGRIIGVEGLNPLGIFQAAQQYG